MPSGRLLVTVCCAVGLCAPVEGPAQAVTRWCAEPRPHEPLLRDAHGLVSRHDSAWASTRYIFDIPLVPGATVDVVRDEAQCRRGAVAYASHMRSVLASEWTERPVLVLRVGEMYLVDDQRSRKGKSAYWTALLFDKNWEGLYEYGAGS